MAPPAPKPAASYSAPTLSTARFHLLVVIEVAASGDLAYERGGWTFDPDGPGEAAEEHGEYVTVWKKMGGGWRATVDAGTTLTAEEEE